MGLIRKYSFLKDWHFWLLFFVINMSGNLCFGYFFPDKLTIIVLFFVVSALLFTKQKSNPTIVALSLSFAIILLLQGCFLSVYSAQSSIHYWLKIFIGCSMAVLVGSRFVEYYKGIMLFFCVISLVCFSLNCAGIVLPYISISDTQMDNGRILRTSSIIYTQLYDASSGVGLTLRNCGPFWEPGAYQGFVNLALLFEVFYLRQQKKLISYPALIYIITVFTTLSTGGYATMFAILSILYLSSNKLSLISKVFAVVVVLAIFGYLYSHLDFMGDKIAEDADSGHGRLSFDISSVGALQLLIGSGLDPKSFMESSLLAVGSVNMLMNYTGVLGILSFYLILIKRLTMGRLIFAAIATLILMNEPFLTAGPFWWSLPILSDYAYAIYRRRLPQREVV